MPLADDVKRNTSEIQGVRGDVRELSGRLTEVQTDVKTLIRMNGTRQGQVGELRGRVAIICAIVLSAVAGLVSIATMIWVSKLG